MIFERASHFPLIVWGAGIFVYLCHPKYGVNMHLDGTSRGLLFLIGDGSVAGGLFLSGGRRRVRGCGFIDVAIEDVVLAG